MKLVTNINIGLIIILGLFTTQSKSGELDPSCNMSLPVKNKTFSLPQQKQTISCVLYEKNRAKIFSSIRDIENSKELTWAKELKKLEEIDRKLLKAEKANDWKTAASIIVANFFGTAGLYSCGPQTAGIGCGFAVFAFLWAKYETISSALPNEDKVKALRELRAQIKDYKKKLKENKNIIHAKNFLINDFNHMCRIVKEKCL